MPLTIKSNGKIYKKSTSYSIKSRATKEVKRLRTKGYNAMIKSYFSKFYNRKLYGVYKRKK